MLQLSLQRAGIDLGGDRESPEVVHEILVQLRPVRRWRRKAGGGHAPKFGDSARRCASDPSRKPSTSRSELRVLVERLEPPRHHPQQRQIRGGELQLRAPVIRRWPPAARVVTRSRGAEGFGVYIGGSASGMDRVRTAYDSSTYPAVGRGFPSCSPRGELPIAAMRPGGLYCATARGLHLGPLDGGGDLL